MSYTHRKETLYRIFYAPFVKCVLHLECNNLVYTILLYYNTISAALKQRHFNKSLKCALTLIYIYVYVYNMTSIFGVLLKRDNLMYCTIHCVLAKFSYFTKKALVMFDIIRVLLANF